MSLPTTAAIEGSGPDVVVRPAIVGDTWTFAGSLPYEARCKLCEAPAIEPGETDHDFTERLRGLGLVFGPASWESINAWVVKHLRQAHGRHVAQTYEVSAGQERWIF